MIRYEIPGSLSGMDAELENALKMVIDPELHVNVVDLGLVYTIKIKEKEHLISVEMTLSSRYCPMAESIVSAVVNCLERVFIQFEAKVSLVWDPIWGFDSITPAGRLALWGKNK